MVIGPETLVLIYLVATILAGSMGAYLYRDERPGLHAGHFSTGAILIVTFVLVTWAVASVATCAVEAVPAGPAPSASSSRALARGSCSPDLWHWYLALRDWQTGIGAGFGLLGVAWAAQLAAAKQRPN